MELRFRGDLKDTTQFAFLKHFFSCPLNPGIQGNDVYFLVSESFFCVFVFFLMSSISLSNLFSSYPFWMKTSLMKLISSSRYFLEQILLAL